MQIKKYNKKPFCTYNEIYVSINVFFWPYHSVGELKRIVVSLWHLKIHTQKNANLFNVSLRIRVE